jgi:predicted alpha-1,2-mannosidase
MKKGVFGLIALTWIAVARATTEPLPTGEQRVKEALTKPLPTEERTMKEPVDWVDMFMGVRGNSNCVIGPQRPHGSVNPAPQTPNGGQGGYKEHQPIRGFAQLHVSGIGWTRYGQVLLSPQTGFNAEEEGHDSPKSDELATPYYYRVRLQRYGIGVELTPTHHGTLYRLCYPTDCPKGKFLLLDMRHSLAEHIVPEVGGRFLGGEIHEDKTTGMLTGWGEYAGGFGSGDPYRVCFAMKVDSHCSTETYKEQGQLYAKIQIDNGTEEVLVRLAVSMKSEENAVRYLNEELVGRRFDDVKAESRQQWNEMLGRIRISYDTQKTKEIGISNEECSVEKEMEMRKFYTALYHSLLMPRDRTGDNPRWESELPHIDDHYCVWDTWRTCYPLLTLIDQEFVEKTINSFIDRLHHDRKCTPTFTASLEFDMKQGGDDVDNIIADAMMKGVGGFDREKAYELLLWDAFHSRNPDYLQRGWIPGEHVMMSCSYTMEYAYNDDCAARVAEQMGDMETAQKLYKRSHQWQQMFNADLESEGFKGFVAPRKAEGEFITIDPTFGYASWVDYFYEGNSWTYTLFTPHDFPRLIELCGGKETMVRRLQHGFDRRLVSLWNEPGFLSPFVFFHCDRPDLAAHYVNKLRQEDYSLERGYPDNEDSGAMGSWYVFTSIGLFPNAGQDIYYLLPPAFDNITLTIAGGYELTIRTTRSSEKANRISRVLLNGDELDSWTIRHNVISHGGVLEFYLTD